MSSKRSKLWESRSGEANFISFRINVAIPNCILAVLQLFSEIKQATPRCTTGSINRINARTEVISGNLRGMQIEILKRLSEGQHSAGAGKSKFGNISLQIRFCLSNSSPRKKQQKTVWFATKIFLSLLKTWKRNSKN